VSSAAETGAGRGSLSERPWLAWAISRVVGLALGGLAVLMIRGNVYFDTTYYGQWAHGALNGYAIPYRDFAWEYPPGALPAMLIPGNRSIAGHASGTSIDSEDTLAFSALAGVHPMIETVPLERAAEAYDRMLSGEARFRMVLTTGA